MTPMSIHREHCYLLGCDDCPEIAGQDDDEGYQLHFATDTEPLAWAADNGWTITEDGHIRCRRCTARSLCHHSGHRWDFWIPCPCAGRIPSHHTSGCPLTRMCLHCGHHEATTLANLPTT
jgi:hypothetical protein